jgi:hypothetical protein
MTNWTERLLEAIDRLTSHGDSPNGPGHRLILTVDVDELERLAAEARTALAQPEPEVAGPITDGRPMNQSYWLALLRHDAYAASFQSVDQYRSALIERASSPRAQPEPEGVGLGDEELLRTYGRAKREHCYDGPIDDWPRREERAATVHGLRAVIAADRARTARPATELRQEGR